VQKHKSKGLYMNYVNSKLELPGEGRLVRRLLCRALDTKLRVWARSGFLMTALALTGCQNAGYVMDTHGVTNKQDFIAADGKYWVFDRPDQRKIMTQPSGGRAVSSGAATGATFGVKDYFPTPAQHRNAALGFLSKTRRSCQLLSSTEIMSNSVEHTYTCN
jgi:hypothetical protein